MTYKVSSGTITQYSLTHHECVALYEATSLQRDQFWAASLAWCSHRSIKIRSSWMFFIQVVQGHLGGDLQFSGRGSKMTWLASASSIHAGIWWIWQRWQNLKTGRKRRLMDSVKWKVNEQACNTERRSSGAVHVAWSITVTTLAAQSSWHIVTVHSQIRTGCSWAAWCVHKQISVALYSLH